MRQRNILCLFLILVMVIALSACSFNNANSTVDKSESPSNTVTDDNNTFTDDNNNGTSDDTGNVDNKEDDKDGADDSFIEKEQPELNEESKALIAAYQKNPTEENYLALRDSVIKNYNSVLAHKESKLAELKEETLGKYNGEAVVAEMDEIVQDMYITYWEHINSSMLRFTDNRLLRWKIADAVNYEYIPVMGAGQTIYVSRIPVTNAQYKQFITDTGYDAPSNWVNGTIRKEKTIFLLITSVIPTRKHIVHGLRKRTVKTPTVCRTKANGNLRRDICRKTLTLIVR